MLLNGEGGDQVRLNKIHRLEAAVAFRAMAAAERAEARAAKAVQWLAEVLCPYVVGNDYIVNADSEGFQKWDIGKRVRCLRITGEIEALWDRKGTYRIEWQAGFGILTPKNEVHKSRRQLRASRVIIQGPEQSKEQEEQ